MRIQQYEWSCGPAVVVNALRCFGVKVSENQVIPVAGTISPSRCPHCRKLKRSGIPISIRRSSDECDVGTCENGVIDALTHFLPDSVLEEYMSDSRDSGWAWLCGSLFLGNVVILCLDGFHHWALALGICGESVILFDPDASASNVAEHGVFVLGKEALMYRWWARNVPENLYAISVSRDSSMLGSQ